MHDLGGLTANITYSIHKYSRCCKATVTQNVQTIRDYLLHFVFLEVAVYISKEAPKGRPGKMEDQFTI